MCDRREMDRLVCARCTSLSISQGCPSDIHESSRELGLDSWQSMRCSEGVMELTRRRWGRGAGGIRGTEDEGGGGEEAGPAKAAAAHLP